MGSQNTLPTVPRDPEAPVAVVTDCCAVAGPQPAVGLTGSFHDARPEPVDLGRRQVHEVNVDAGTDSSVRSWPSAQRPKLGSVLLSVKSPSSGAVDGAGAVAAARSEPACIAAAWVGPRDSGRHGGCHRYRRRGPHTSA